MTATFHPSIPFFARKVGVGLVLVTALSARVEAQGPHVILPEPLAQTFRQPVTVASSRAAIGIIGSGAKDHRYTGLYVGLGTAVLGGVIGIVSCTNQDASCDVQKHVLGTIAAAAILGGVGAMIGRAFPKHPPPATAAPGID